MTLLMIDCPQPHALTESCPACADEIPMYLRRVSRKPADHVMHLTTEDRDGRPCSPVCTYCGASETYCTGTGSITRAYIDTLPSEPPAIATEPPALPSDPKPPIPPPVRGPLDEMMDAFKRSVEYTSRLMALVETQAEMLTKLAARVRVLEEWRKVRSQD